MWSWCEWTPPGDSRPMRCAVPPDCLQRGDELGEVGVLGERAVRDGFIDARQVLHDDAAGADIHVADLGIPHLARGQADERSRSPAASACGLAATMRSQFGVLRLKDAVVLPLGAVAPAVEDAEHDGAAAVGSGHVGRIMLKQSKFGVTLAFPP